MSLAFLNKFTMLQSTASFKVRSAFRTTTTHIDCKIADQFLLSEWCSHCGTRWILNFRHVFNSLKKNEVNKQSKTPIVIGHIIATKCATKRFTGQFAYSTRAELTSTPNLNPIVDRNDACQSRNGMQRLIRRSTYVTQLQPQCRIKRPLNMCKQPSAFY